MDRAYEDAIKRIDHQPANRRYYARLTISWMVQCLQPMTPRELQHAVTKPEHLERGPTASGLVKIDALVSFCAGLVTIDHESNVIRFVHYTTQEYFTRDRLIKWLPGADLDTARLCTTYLMNPRLLQAIEGAHEKWSEHMRKRKEHDKIEMLPQDVPENWPFLEYCKKHWGSHCSKFQEPLETLLLQFLTGPAEIVYCELDLQWDEIVFKADLWSHVDGDFVCDARLRRVNPVSICARWGLQHLTSKLLDQGFDCSVAPFLKVWRSQLWPENDDRPRSRGVADDEPFLLACQFGHMELAALLLARTSISDDVYYEAFQAADENKDLEMLNLIITKCPLDTISLERIAACSSIDGPRIKNVLLQHTLQLSVDQRLEELQPLFRRPSASFWVEYLLKQGLDVNKTYRDPCGDPCGYDYTGIELAARAGCIEIVRVLLNCSDVQVCQSNIQAMELAAAGGYVEVFRALLSHVSSMSATSDSFQCSIRKVFLAVACSDGPQRSQTTLTKSLLESQVLNRLHFEHLEEAFRYLVSGPETYECLDVQEAVMDLILHHSSIDFRRRGIHGRTLLQTAVPRALSNYIETSNMTKESVLADGKFTRTMSMLLKHPAFDCSDQYNPLIECLTGDSWHIRQTDSHLGIIANFQMLLEDSRFNPDNPDEGGRTALSHASEHHILDLVKMLLQHPLVNVNSRDRSGRTPLSYAALSEWQDGGKSVLPILLENDDVREHANCPDSAGITPLMYGCRRGQAETVGLLLDVVGTEANLQDNRGRTPLLHALEAECCDSYFCEHKILPVLLVLLANPNIMVNAKDKDGRSATFYALKLLSRNKDTSISLLLQHEGLDISEGLLEMRDENGEALDAYRVLWCVSKLRETNSEPWEFQRRLPLNPTESRHLDLIELIFSAGRSPA